MNIHGPQEARDALRRANEAVEQGARAGARPWWYPVGLGLSAAFALGSFAVPWLTTTGVVLGGILFPLALEAMARRRSGASPVKTYCAPGFRVPSAVFVVLGAGLCASALILLKTSGNVVFVLVAAVLLGIVTAACTWRVSRHRRTGSDAGAAR